MQRALLLTLLASVSFAQEGPADLVLRGRIATVDAARPAVEALAARGGRVVALGTPAEVERWIGGATVVLDLPAGALATPGFIEGHAHFLGVGDATQQLDLMGVETWEEVVGMVAEAARRAAPGELIRGRGWHQEKWTHLPPGSVEGVPQHRTLSSISGENPVVLTHASGHAAFANALAMEMSGITGDTPDPEGGELVRDEHGRPTGMFRETAQGLLAPARMRAKAPDTEKLARLASAECLSKGVTSFQDAGSSFEDVAVLRGMAERGELGVRLWMMLRESNGRVQRNLEHLPLIDLGDHHLTVRAVKRSIDGALGSHGAWLLEPYADMPSSAGLNTASVAGLVELAAICRDGGLQLCVHAIGDRANREVLDLYERALAGHERGAALRWRIEHAQHLHPADIPRFAKLGVIASMQGVHCTSDGPWVPERLGEQRSREGAYVWRSLLDSNAVVTNGTDAPVEDVDPLPSFHASVTRVTKDGSAFFPEQCMTRAEALRSYTLACAFAAFEEDDKGSLEVGKLADVTVFSKDILRCPADEIRAAQVLYTIVGGELLYRRD
jgi:hypothetical protein